ncbi:MAG: RAD55 family ATPase [Thaumarchaeota archaeon]|nr:RAD55 family ATPase [Nitrososphaerota archaeon]
MASTGISELDTILGGNGYPDRSGILTIGAPGIGKEALGYHFTQSGLAQGDFCVYLTRLAAREVVKDAKAYGVDYQQRVPLWIASDGGLIKYESGDLAGLSFNIKEVMRKNSDRRFRIVTDVLSPLLMLNASDVVYKFLTQLMADIKQYDAVLLATLEDGMHTPQVVTAMQALFDGVLDLRVYEEGISYVPILKVRKMMGAPPQPGYFSFSFSRNGMEIRPYAKLI